MKRLIVLLVLGAMVVGCAPANKEAGPKPSVQPRPEYPYIQWRKRTDGPFTVVGESRRRVFVMEVVDGTYTLKSYNKKGGRLYWSVEVTPKLHDPSDPWSFDVAVLGRAIALWTKNDTIVGLDKYTGAEIWDKPVEGNGLAVLGVNFVTWKGRELKIIEPDTGKVTPYTIEREITGPVVPTPKGYLAVMVGEELWVVDLGEDSVKVKNRIRLDLRGGFVPGIPYPTEERVVLYQETVPEEEYLDLVSLDASSAQPRWKVSLRGRVPMSQGRFIPLGDGKGVLAAVESLSTPERYWELYGPDGKKVGELITSTLPRKECVIGTDVSFCATDKGVEAYQTSTWKKAWFRETIYPIDGLRHAFVGDVILLAAGVRIKALRKDGNVLFAIDVKGKKLKDPRAIAVLGSKGSTAFVAVVDSAMGSKQDVGEIWAVDVSQGKVLWRKRVGKSSDVRTSVLFSPQDGAIFVANSRKLVRISLDGGRMVSRNHGLRKASRIRLVKGRGAVVLWFGDRAVVFDSSRMRKVKTLKVGKRVPVMATPKMAVLLDLDARRLTGLDLRKGKELWKVEKSPFTIVPKTFLLGSGKFLMTSVQGTWLVDEATGKHQELSPTVDAAMVGGQLVLASKRVEKSKVAWRMVAYPYEQGTDPAWSLDSTKFGFTPSWRLATADYLMLGDGAHLLILLGEDGTKVLSKELKLVAPPVLYMEKLVFTRANVVVQMGLDGNETTLFKSRHDLHLRATVPIDKPVLYLREGDHVIEAVRLGE